MLIRTTIVALAGNNLIEPVQKIELPDKESEAMQSL